MYLFRILDEERVQTEHLQQTRVGHFRLALLAVLLFYRLGRADDAVLVMAIPVEVRDMSFWNQVGEHHTLLLTVIDVQTVTPDTKE